MVSRSTRASTGPAVWPQSAARDSPSRKRPPTESVQSLATATATDGTSPASISCRIARETCSNRLSADAGEGDARRTRTTVQNRIEILLAADHISVRRHQGVRSRTCSWGSPELGPHRATSAGTSWRFASPRRRTGSCGRQPDSRAGSSKPLLTRHLSARNA
jgi:hypothetical protein